MDIKRYISFAVEARFIATGTRKNAFNQDAVNRVSTIRKITLFFGVLLIFFAFGAKVTSAAVLPVLNFSDLTNGPKSGLGDGLGEGAIVTVWGRNIGSSQGSSKIYFKDSAGVSREAAHVYYWGNADGVSGGGPANLYASHGMQEISFSIPAASADGAGKIYVEMDGVNSNELDFYARSTGKIYHVKTTGSDLANGSWNTPWLTMDRAVGSATSPSMIAGDVVYVGDGVAVNSTYGVSIGSSLRKQGTPNNMLGIIAYPGASVLITATSTGVRNYNYDNAYWVVSKLEISTGGTGIMVTRYGRIIANKITGPTADGSSAAISGGAGGPQGGPYVDYISAVKVLGNYIHDFGSSATSNLHHTTYFSIRRNITAEGIDIGWNRLEDNKARFGIHYYDENWWGEIGSLSSPSYVHDNWIRNQGGPGINIGSTTGEGVCPDMTGTWYVYNNILVNCGLTTDQGIASPPYAISLYGEVNKFDIHLFNNTIYGYGDVNSTGSVALSVGNGWPFGGTWTYRNNIVVDTKNFSWNNSSLKLPASASNNLWYSGGDGNPADAPAWDQNPLIVDPLFVNVALSNFDLQSTSPARNAGSSAVSSIVMKDYRGVIRPQESNYDIGALEYDEGADVDRTPPNIPVGLTIQ